MSIIVVILNGGVTGVFERAFTVIMITDFFIVLMTKHLSDQLIFYKELLELELIFDNKDTVGLGKNGQLFVMLREDKFDHSHHLAEQKGPQLMTFKCQGNLEETRNATKHAGFKVRDSLLLPENKAQYLFVEDFDANEVCLEFPITC